MATRQDQLTWPLYELANYDNSGRLIDLCKDFLAESPSAHNENKTGQADQNTSKESRRKQSNEKKLKASCATTTTTTTTSGYQTLDDNKQQRAAGERTGNTDRASERRKGERLRQSNKSPDGNARQILWWHLIEPAVVSYGDLDEVVLPSRQADHYELDSFAFCARFQKLCLELRRLIVGPFLVARVESTSEPSLVTMSRSRTVSSLNVGRLATTHETAQLRRLSWRRRRGQIGRIGPGSASASTLVRSDTFTLVAAEEPTTTTTTTKLRKELSNETKSERRAQKPIERWLAQAENQVSAAPGRSVWSRAVNKRGKYGESLVHLLLIQHTNEHLILLLVLLHLWPELLFDVFESEKFKHLNCLHLTIAHGNERLLAHLLELAREVADRDRFRLFVEQRVSGSLFRSPSLNCLLDVMPSTGHRQDTVEAPSRGEKMAQLFWCDQLEHWPSANGREHLILFDRIARSKIGVDASNRKRQEAAPSCESQIYFGQTPLAWAVSFESKEMFELLAGPSGEAEVLAGDELANNCLHQLVINNQLNWTRFLLKFDKRLATRANNLHLTPFLLACHLGRTELLNELLELSAVEFWTYSSVKCCAYPLESLDSIVVTSGIEKGSLMNKNNNKSAISVILESSHSSDEQKSALLSTGVIKKLLEEKWKIFARRLFYRDLLLTLVQLLLLTIAFYLRPSRINLDYMQELKQTQALWSDANELSAGIAKRFLQDYKQQLLRNTCELIVVLIALSKVRQFLLEWAHHRNLSLQFTYNPMVANLVLANLLVALCLPIRLMGLTLRVNAVATMSKSQQQEGELLGRTNVNRLHQLDQLEDILLILASPLLWSSLLFFVAAFYVTGPFVAMINYMLMRDLKQFSLIYLIFLYSFAQSIFFINFHQHPGAAAGGNESLALTGKNGPVVAEILMAVDQNTNRTAGVDHLERGTDDDELALLTQWLGHLGTKYLELWLELFKMTLGVYEFQPYRHSLQSRLLLTLFLHLIPILFNMLIAMMNNTYSQIIAQSERAWSFQWARTLFALERRLGDQEKELYLREYAINLASSISASYTGPEDATKATMSDVQVEEEPPFVPGLMIIKRTDCTRAELKRRLVVHWQRSTRRILDELKERGQADRQFGERAPPAGLWTH